MAGASTSIGAFANKSSSPYKMSKSKRAKNSRRNKVKVDDPEASNGFLLSGQNDYDGDGFVSSTSSPEETVRGRKRPNDSLTDELV